MIPINIDMLSIMYIVQQRAPGAEFIDQKFDLLNNILKWDIWKMPENYFKKNWKNCAHQIRINW